MVSAVQEQRDIILETIKNISRGEWMVLVIDDNVRKIIDNVMKEDDILRESITNIENIMEKREMNTTMDAIYLLSPEPHIVDCLMADFERRRYAKAYIVWTSLLDPPLAKRISASREASSQIGGVTTLSIDYFPRESHLITFRDPWSFPILYHPACNAFVKDHMQSLAQKIMGVCVSMGENPKVRYYLPRNATHEASVLCTHLARFVQEELDAYARFHNDWPPPSPRPQGILVITDRSMDLIAPIIHEFTYQAMAHDVLQLKETDKIYYKTTVNEEEKEMEIGEKDKIWIENRHRHMATTVDKLVSDFRKFMEDNQNFTNSEAAASLSAIKDMMAGLANYQETKEAYSLHINMARECMDIFQDQKLPDLASVEQSLATGSDENFQKPKNLADQVIRLLDDEIVPPSDRMRLILQYLIYRDGVILDDVQRLLAHASLSPLNGEVITNIELLGARTMKKALKDVRPATQPLFPKTAAPTEQSDEFALSRFAPTLKTMLDNIVKGTLDQTTFPYVKASQDNSEELAAISQASLRSAKPTWARNRMSTVENKQRIFVFMAGGATYSESRVCYDVAKTSSKEIFLTTSHMLTPNLYVRQLGDLSVDRRRLDLPIERPKPRAPAYLFKANDPKPVAAPLPSGPRVPSGTGTVGRSGMLPNGDPAQDPYARAPQPPTAGLAAMSVNSAASKPPPANVEVPSGKLGKLEKKSKHEGEEKEKKKKRGFFSSKK